MILETYNIAETFHLKTVDEIFNELIETGARIPRIDKIIDLWDAANEESQDVPEVACMSLSGLRRYLEYMTHYPITADKFYLACAPNGAIGLTAYFDTYKLIMRFDSTKTITYIKWGDYSERLP